MFRHSFIIFLIIIWQIPTFAQRVEFGYDQRGNRNLRTIVFGKLTDTLVQDDPGLKHLNPEVFNDKIGAISFNIFPNPTKGQIIIKITGEITERSVGYKVLNLQGQLIVQEDFIGSGQAMIDLSGEDPGVYLLIISHQTAQKVWKIVKE